MTATAKKLTLTLAVLLAALLATAAPGEARASEALRHRFRATSRAETSAKTGVHFTTLQALVADVVTVDDLSTWHGLPSMQVLRAMYDAVTATGQAGHQAQLSTVNLQGKVREKEAGDQQPQHFSNHVVDDPQLQFFKKLRTKFPKTNQLHAHPRVKVFGEGPAGLSAAIEARRLGKAATVVLRGKRPRYIRQHVVTTWRSKTLAGENFNNIGVEQLLKQELGILSQVPAIGHTYTHAIFHSIKWEAENGSSRKIQICDLERLLLLIAQIVGVQVSFAPDDHAAAAASRAIQRTAANQQPAQPGQSFAPLTAPAAFAQPDERDAVAYDEAFEVIVGADGVGSTFRHNYMPDAAFVPPKMFAGEHLASARNEEPENRDISATLRARGGLVTVGFVFDFAGADVPANVATACDRAAHNAVNSPAYFLDNPRDSDRGILGFYTKSLVADPKKVCQLEVEFKKEAGKALLQVFGGHDSYNYNLKSPTDVGQADKTKLQLLRMVLARALRPDKADQLSAIFLRVSEFKVWQNNLRMSLDRDHFDNEGSGDGTNNAVMARVAGDRVFVLVGDSAREALPNSGMGVNDAHGMAQLLGEKINDIGRGWGTPEEHPERATKLGEVQTALSPHEKLVVKQLHAAVRPSVVTDPDWADHHRILHDLGFSAADGGSLTVGVAA